MEATLIILLLLVLLVLLAGARWFRDELRRPRYKALLFLSVQSHEDRERIPLPEKSILLRKPLLLHALPTPGMELDGHGTEPIKITRSVLDEHAEHHILLYLEPVRVPLANVEEYAKNLVQCCILFGT
jgi:hypothetical protein